MWDYTAGPTVGMLALELMILSFAVSAVVLTLPQGHRSNFLLIAAGCAVLVLACDWLFFYYMPGYSGAWNRFLLVRAPQRGAEHPGPACPSIGRRGRSALNSRSTTAWSECCGSAGLPFREETR